MTFWEVDLAFPKQLAGRDSWVEEGSHRVYFFLDHQNFADEDRPSGKQTQLTEVSLFDEV